MSRLTIGQKATRVLGFLMGLRNRRVAMILAAHGFGEADLKEGWRRMAALTEGRLDGALPPADADPTLLANLDAWENKWFPILNASLSARFPAAHRNLFRNLAQTEGPEVVVSVKTLLNRLDALGKTGEDREVRDLCERRGLNKKVMDEARQLLEKLATIDETPEPKAAITPEQDALLDAQLWSWYREWSAIARAVITDRRALRALGFLTERGTPVSEEEEDEEEDEADEAATPRAGGANGPVAPGMPGSDPFLEEEEEPTHNA